MDKQMNHQQFSGLELLPTSLLEKIIQADLQDEADYSEEMILFVLQLLETRKANQQQQPTPDVEEAWSRFQILMEEAQAEPDLPPNSPCPQQNKPTKSRSRIFRYVGVAAACVALVFAMLITVQAVGVDVFGSLGKWTDEVFRFDMVEKTGKEIDDSKVSLDLVKTELQKALYEMDMPVTLAPTWIPEEYTMTHLEKYWLSEFNTARVAYERPGSNKILSISIEWFADPQQMRYYRFFKSPGDPEIYEKGELKFYIFLNYDVWTATCAYGNYCIIISGADSVETAIKMIDSIEEVNYE